MKTKLFFLTVFFTCVYVNTNYSYGQKFNKQLQEYVNTLPDEFNQISDERKQVLEKIGDHTFQEEQKNLIARPLFICTHNSRRSQMSQAWLLTASYYYGINNISPSSGGTEATAFNQRAADALKRAGFKVFKGGSNPDNPTYLLTIGKRYNQIMLFSKKYTDNVNPQKDFYAIMVCSDADESCPLVQGADARFSLPYDDPRYADNTASEAKTYDERCRQIAREMFYIMDYVKKKIVIMQEKKKK